METISDDTSYGLGMSEEYAATAKMRAQGFSQKRKPYVRIFMKTLKTYDQSLAEVQKVTRIR